MPTGMHRKQLAARVREAREAAGISQDQARKAIDVSQPTYSRIESGDRALRGDELVQLADCFGVRAAAITGLADVRERARFAARTEGGPARTEGGPAFTDGARADGNPAPMAAMRERLYAYLELDSYLTDQGIPGGPR